MTSHLYKIYYTRRLIMEKEVLDYVIEKTHELDLEDIIRGD